MTSDLLYSSRLVWIFVFIALYVAYLLFWGVRGSRLSSTSLGFFLADQQLPAWPYLMAATAVAFAGWLFVSLPGLVLRDGLPAAYLAFAAIFIPFLAALLGKRQWLLARRYGFITAGEMYSAYFGDRGVGVFTAVVAVLFAVPFLGLFLSAAGDLISVASGNEVPSDVAMWGLAAVLVICSTLGGINGISRAGPLQAVLIVSGIAITGLAAYHMVGGFDALSGALARIAESGVGRWGTTKSHGGGDYSALFAVSGVAQWIAGLGRDLPAGNPWTGVMVMSFLLALSGIQLSPAISMLTFASSSPRPFAPQQVWAAGGMMGLLLFVFVPLIGLAGMVLGADAAVSALGLVPNAVLPDLSGDRQGLVAAALIGAIATAAPWLAGILAVCFVVAITASAGAHMLAAGAAVTRDLYVGFFNASAEDGLQRAFARIVMLIVGVLALLMATFAKGGMVALASLTLALAVQLLPASLAVTWVPWFTRQGIQAGLVVGAIVCVLTDPLGQLITGGVLPWGYWPWTIHAAGWGIVANFAACTLGSAVSQNGAERARRDRCHAFLREFARNGAPSRRLVSTTWVVTMVWLFFACGPGIVLGNYLFGEPNAGLDDWDFRMPSIWAWQLIWWGLGVLMLWFLAYRLQLAVPSSKEVIPLPRRAGPAMDRRTKPAGALVAD
jgi:Na+/proline symporter